MPRRDPNFWWISFTDNTIKLFDDETQVTKEAWLRHAPAKDAVVLQRELEEHPQLVVAQPG